MLYVRLSNAVMVLKALVGRYRLTHGLRLMLSWSMFTDYDQFCRCALLNRVKLHLRRQSFVVLLPVEEKIALFL